jgi:hypothetical protein
MKHVLRSPGPAVGVEVVVDLVAVVDAVVAGESAIAGKQ